MRQNGAMPATPASASTVTSPRVDRAFRVAAVVAVAGFVAALLIAGRGFDGYSHLDHPFALGGAAGVPGAGVFNLLAFWLPGVVAAATALRWRARLDDAAPLASRLAARLLLLSALAFAAQGLWPLDLDNLDAGDSRFHATAWMAWLIAGGCAALAQALAARGGRRLAPALVALVLLACLLLPQAWVAAGIAQRLAFAAWFAGWLPVAWARAAPRGAAWLRRPISRP